MRIETNTGTNNTIKKNNDTIDDNIVNTWSRTLSNSCEEEYVFDLYGNLRIKSLANIMIIDYSVIGSDARKELKFKVLAKNGRNSCQGSSPIATDGLFFTINDTVVNFFSDSNTDEIERSLRK